MHRTIRWTAVLSLLAASTGTMAQESLLEVYQRAASNDPTLREAEANYSAVRQTKPLARSSLLPNVNLSGNQTGSYNESIGGFGIGNVNFGDGNNSRNSGDGFNLNLSQTLFDMSILRTLKQADKQVAQAELNLEQARQDLVLRVAVAYFSVLGNENLLAAEVAAREAIARQLEQAQRRFDVGLIAITDVQQAQAAYDLAIATEIGAQRSLASAQEVLREIVGEYISDLQNPIGELPLLPPDPASSDDWVNIAMRQNIALAATRMGTEIAEDDIGILRAARLPTLSLSGGYSTSASNSSTTTITGGIANPPFPRSSESDGRNWSINLRVPLYTGGANSARIQQSVYRYRAAQEGLERVVRSTERQTRDAYLGVISEISRVRALQQAVESNRTALRATEAGFEVGTQTTVDVLASQNNLRRAETNYAISRFDYITNLLRLRQAAGSLSVADIEQVDEWLE